MPWATQFRGLWAKGAKSGMPVSRLSCVPISSPTRMVSISSSFEVTKSPLTYCLIKPPFGSALCRNALTAARTIGNTSFLRRVNSCRQGVSIQCGRAKRYADSAFNLPEAAMLKATWMSASRIVTLRPKYHDWMSGPRDVAQVRPHHVNWAPCD